MPEQQMPILPRNYFAPEGEFEAPSESIVLGHTARTISRYRYPIVASILAAGLLYGVIAILAYLLGPSQQITALPFRLEFEGAEQGLYPNKTKFNPAEIIATPILSRVYNSNELQRFVSFNDFSDAVFVVESNKALEQLGREYQAKLSDPKLNLVDRERLEKEFEMKRESLGRSEYAVNFASTRKTTRLPGALVDKSLGDILAAWAKSAAEEKGVLRYRVPVLSANVLDRGILASENHVITLDILRTRIDSVMRNIDSLLGIPGAEVLRTARDGVSLTEIRLRLGDVVRFEIQPLIARIRASGSIPDSRETTRYVQSQLDYNKLQAKTAEAKTQALRQSLDLYTNRPAELELLQGPTTPASGATTQSTLMPQISESFLDRLIELTGRNSDIQYRQELVDRIEDAAVEALPYQQEAEYYRDLLDQMRTAVGGGPPSGTEPAIIRQQLQDIYDDIANAIQQVNTIYRLLSDNLNTSHTIYSVTSPAVVRIERGVSLKRLFLYGVLLLLIAIPLAIAGALLHNRVKEEAELEDVLVAEARQPQTGVDTQPGVSGPAATAALKQ